MGLLEIVKNENNDLKKINSLDILGNEDLKNSFLTATLNDINQKCYIFKGNFFSFFMSLWFKKEFENGCFPKSR